MFFLWGGGVFVQWLGSFLGKKIVMEFVLRSLFRYFDIKLLPRPLEYLVYYSLVSESVNRTPQILSPYHSIPPRRERGSWRGLFSPAGCCSQAHRSVVENSFCVSAHDGPVSNGQFWDVRCAYCGPSKGDKTQVFPEAVKRVTCMEWKRGIHEQKTLYIVALLLWQ